MISETAVAVIVSAVTSGFFALLWQRIRNVRPDKKLTGHLLKRLDALAATALELAVEDVAEIEDASLSFGEVADRLSAHALVTQEGQEELLDLWEVRTKLAQDPDGPGLPHITARHLLTKTEKLIESLGRAPPSRGG